jgi:hypothetical protein
LVNIAHCLLRAYPGERKSITERQHFGRFHQEYLIDFLVMFEVYYKVESNTIHYVNFCNFVIMFGNAEEAMNVSEYRVVDYLNWLSYIQRIHYEIYYETYPEMM